MPPNNPVRIRITEQLLDKLHRMGVLEQKTSLSRVERLTASAFARRRLPVILVRLKYCEHLEQATEFVRQGQIRVGPEVINDPAFLVSRAMADFITWADGSKIKAAVAKYNDKLDDFDLLGE